MESAPAPLRFRTARLIRPDVDAFSEYLDDDDDDQPTPKLSANVALAAETPAARLRALLSRVPSSKPIHTLVPPPSSLPSSSRSDLVDSDVDAPDEYQRPPPANHLSATTSFSFARESIRDIFMRARREPGDTPQKDNTSKPRRSSFDELDSFPERTRDRSKRSGKRKSLSDEELESLPSDLRQSERPFASGSQTVSIDNLRERLLMESQTQLQDEYPPSLYEQTPSSLNISHATPPAATSTPHAFPRKATNSRAESHLPSQLDSKMIQSNLLDVDSEMQRAIENVESDGDYDNELNNVPFPPGAPPHVAEPPTPLPSSSMPGRSRIPLTRSRLNSLDKAYAGTNFQTVGGEARRSVSRTSSISSSMSFCSDEAERIRERERDWNKPKVPVRPSTPELKQGHRHGRFSSRIDSPMVGGSSTRRASINSLDDFSPNSMGSQAEYRERTAEVERERIHERERQWNKRRPRLSYPSPGSLSQIHRERTRSVSLTQIPRPNSAMSISSTASLQRDHSFSPSSNASSPEKRGSPSEPPEEYLHERERNWNAPRPRWLQNPDVRSSPSSSGSQRLTSLNGRRRANSLRSTGSSSQNEEDYPNQPLPLSAPVFNTGPSSPHSKPQSYPDQNMQHGQLNSPTRNIKSEQGSQSHSPSHSHIWTRSTPPPGPGSRPTQIPIRTPTKTATRTADAQQNVVHEHKNGDIPLVTMDSVNDIQPRHRVEGHPGVNRVNEPISQDRTPTIRTIDPLSVESPEDLDAGSPYFDPGASDGSTHAPATDTRPQELPTRKTRAMEVTSFLQTPPRPSAGSSGASFEFQSPSPPKGLPELPGPPPMSDEEVEELDYTSIAWERTPGHPITEDAMAGVGNSTAMKTPRPPGAWLTTPALLGRAADGAAKVRESLIVSNETEYSDAHATPVASLSRASALQTPAPPGAWVPTPAASSRKSILRVRFEPPPSESTETEQSITASSENSDFTPEISKRSSSPTDRPVEVRSSTPDLQIPVAKLQSPKSPRKSPKIRVLDAFGREALDYVAKNEETTSLSVNTPRNRSAIRIVDAMGREVDEGSRQDLRGENVHRESLPSPLDRQEAFKRLREVREGLSDLADRMDEIDRVTPDKVYDVRAQELDDLSRKARAKREELATRLCTAETGPRIKLQKVRGKAQSDRHMPRIPSGLFWTFFVLQVVLILAMYQFATKQARDIFLSTYYDPFYPDLHLYTIRPDTLRQRVSSSSSWISFLDTLQRDGWKATFSLLQDTVSLYIYDIRTRIWETWGGDATQQVASWPPT
ncbi:hypothetical protein AX15_004672 [Amanita polypyramis BW_CC]|nr:hypothetical protein AX15_004672 [Amanita polypyramis BW_CC]